MTKDKKLSTEMIDDQNITSFSQVKWRTPLSKRIDQLSDILNNDEAVKKHFSENYIEKIALKSHAISSTNFKLYALFAAIMLSLFASSNTNDSDFEIFGYSFKNLQNHKEFLLLLAAIIQPISSLLSAYQKYLDAVVEECLKKISPDKVVRSFLSHQYLNKFHESLFAENTGNRVTWHGFTVFLTVMLGVMITLMSLTLLAGMFFIQINVIYNVATQPASSGYINTFVLVFATGSILFSWLVTIIQFPMPEVDQSNLIRLSQLKEEDPDKHREVMKDIARINSKKEAITIFFWLFSMYIIGFALSSMYWYPDSLIEITYYLPKAMIGAFFVMFFSNQIISYVKKIGWTWFFNKFPDESDHRLKVFVKMQRTFSFGTALLPLLGAIGYAHYALSTV